MEPVSTDDATKRAVKILDAKYERANLVEITKQATHLNKEEQRKLTKHTNTYLFNSSDGLSL